MSQYELRGRTFGVLEVEQLECAVAFEGPFEVPDRAVDFGNDDAFGKALGDLFCDIHWAGLPRSTLALRAIGQRDLNLFSGLSFM